MNGSRRRIAVPYGGPVATEMSARRHAALLVVIAVGGAIGSLARHSVSIIVGAHSPQDLPWGTLGVNVVGCLAIGVLATMLPIATSNWWVRPLVITGVLGGFTTFSAFALETGVLLDAGATGMASLYVGGSVLAGLLAVHLGRLLARGSR
jgi:CrcB protein